MEQGGPTAEVFGSLALSFSLAQGPLRPETTHGAVSKGDLLFQRVPKGQVMVVVGKHFTCLLIVV